MTAAEAAAAPEGLLAALLSDESFRPAEPHSLEEAGLTSSFVETLVAKYLAGIGSASGRAIADFVCLPFGLIENVLKAMRTRQFAVQTSSAALGDYYYALTEQGRERTNQYLAACAYVGPAPVPLADYVLSVHAQTIRAEAPRREQLEQAFEGITIDPELFDSLGPAINSGAGLFLYGSPGNGKSTLASRITMCFGQHIWIPHTLFEDGQIVKLYDAAYHEQAEHRAGGLLKSADYDRRWVRVKRPTVVVGGELTMDGLELRHDPRSNVAEAPLQLKSNCGCFLIDDFGRQRINPLELLNRWIVPLENRVDYLTLMTGKKIQVPFEQLIIFSTNLEPKDLVDEAFLRRIPYKIEVCDPGENEFHELFQLYAAKMDCEYRPDVVDDLLERHFRPTNRPMRRCHPRDLLGQVRNYCAYQGAPLEMLPEYFDRAVKSYFTVVVNK